MLFSATPEKKRRFLFALGLCFLSFSSYVLLYVALQKGQTHLEKNIPLQLKHFEPLCSNTRETSVCERSIHLHDLTEEIDLEPIPENCPYNFTYLRFLFRDKRVNLPMCIWEPTDDTFISKTIHGGGLWDRKIVIPAMKILKFEPPGLVIDAGANIGQFTLLSAWLGHTVVAFEPYAPNVDMLIKTLRMNGLQKKVLIYQNALSNECQKMGFKLPERNKGGLTLVDESADGVESIRLDDVLDRLLSISLPLIYLKMDIEGFTERAIQGADSMFDKLAPSFMALEVQPKMNIKTSCSSVHLLKSLESLGYGLFLDDCVTPLPESEIYRPLFDSCAVRKKKN